MAGSFDPLNTESAPGAAIDMLSKEELAQWIERLQERLGDPSLPVEERRSLDSALQRTRAELFSRWLRERTGSG